MTSTSEVDALVGAMASRLDVVENALKEHPRYDQYKNYGLEKEKQKARREEWLKRHKEGRLDHFEERRRRQAAGDIADDETVASHSAAGFVDDSVEMTDKSSNNLRSRRPHRNISSSETGKGFKPGSWNAHVKKDSDGRQRDELKGRLMYSEWLIDVPEDFHQAWIMLPAPVAKRVIIVLENRSCLLFNKAGRQIKHITLPYRLQEPVILDGFFDGDLKVYILDFIKCGPVELEGCDFDCRRFMGTNYLNEKEILGEKNKPEKCAFELANPVIDCTKEAMEKFLSEPTPYELDGLMFYYRDGKYTSGYTPLVTWLKPWMMPEVLGVQVNAVFMKHATSTSKEFIDKFSKEHPTYGTTMTRKEMLSNEKNMEVSA